MRAVPDAIEIKSTGEIVCNYLTVGTVSFDVPFPREYEGIWFPEDDKGVIDSLTEEVNGLEDELEGAKAACEGAAEAIAAIINDDRAAPDWVAEALAEIADNLREAT